MDQTKAVHSEMVNPQGHSVMAKPLHLQRLDAALDMRSFMAFARKMLAQPLSSETDSDEEAAATAAKAGEDFADAQQRQRQRMHKMRLVGSKEDRQFVKMQLYNFNDLTSDREWLYELLMSDTDTETEISDEDDYVRDILKQHVREKKLREDFYKTPKNSQFAYYGAGLLSNQDMYPEHQQSIVGVRKRRRRTMKEKPIKLPKQAKQLKQLKQRRSRKKRLMLEQPEPGEIHPSELKNYAFGDTIVDNDDDEDDDDDDEGDDNDVDNENNGSDDLDAGMETASSSNLANLDGKRKSRKSHAHRTPEVMAARRRRVWQIMAKKELGRYQRAKFNNHKEMVQNAKRVATMCSKLVRQRAMLSQKVMKETVWRAKRLTREMLGYWKRYERVERDTRRRMEKEAEEQRKMDVELIEAKRQQRKLNFLITQTELYAHFMSKKLGQGSEEEQLRILNQLDEEANPRLAAYDDYNAEHMKQLAQQNAAAAFDVERNKTKQFDVAAKIKQEKAEELAIVKTDERADLPQPAIFKGTLKTYQIKGMTWLANLYDQGISGILADEMGLGKTVQSIAFLCHIAEHYGVWGPFLIISPASTLHNWQQEMQRFVPDFNVVPYWGSPNERKILRQFWEQKDLHTREASFHVVITSYQLIVSDYKYFNRIKWQYMVLDEAQAIKSATSMRWKMLLGFNCRNRLLLSGTPIQNSMAELWALLHFIMPTLFDSHDEFNEWFSKDIESHAENKTGIDERQISRLHMILKPFMLRRIKKDVENELSDKIEIMVYCPLTIRQKLLYVALKKKIRIEDLLHLTGAAQGDGHHVDRNFTSNLMNLVMQFRKVCNHPELFERRDVKSAFTMRCKEYVLPRLLYDEALLYKCIPSKRHWLYNRFNIFKAAHVRQAFYAETKTKGQQHYQRFVDLNMSDSCFSFARFCDLSLQDIEDLTINGLITFFLHYRRHLAQLQLLAYRQYWWTHYRPSRYQLLEPKLSNPMLESDVLRRFVFTGLTYRDSNVYAFGDYTLNSMQETMEHRLIRSKHCNVAKKAALIEEMVDSKVNIKLETDEIAEDEKISDLVDKSAIDESHDPLHFKHVPRAARKFYCEPFEMPRFLYGLGPRVQALQRRAYCDSRAAEWSHIRHMHCENPTGLELVNTGLDLCKPRTGWSSIIIPDKQTLVSDAGKLSVLDSLLTRLKKEGHRVLIYSQMTKMIDLLEEYMWHRKHRYMRLDGSSKISARRDMVADFQTRADIFVFLLSTRAGGLGINLTAADTVIFYDSDWNPTVDQQAMDRAHRLGQTKQVTVYRLICKGTIEERILQRAREKSEIQRMVISGGNFKPDTLKPKEVVSLLLDDEEIELKYRQKTESAADLPTATTAAQAKEIARAERKRNHKQSTTVVTRNSKSDAFENDNATAQKRIKPDQNSQDEDSLNDANHSANETFVPGATAVLHHDDSDNENVIVDCEGSSLHGSDSPMFFSDFGSLGPIRRRHHPRGTKRGRPRGSTRRGGSNGSMSRSLSSPIIAQTADSNSANDATDSQQQQQEQQALGDNSSFATTVPLPMRRGPGRPRIKTGGPINTGLRGAPRTRKPIGPLVVPLGRSPAATPLNRSPAISPAPSPAQTSAANRSPFTAATAAVAESTTSSNNIKDN